MSQSVISGKITCCIVLVLCYTVCVPCTRYQVPGTVDRCTNNREDGSESWTFGRIRSFGNILDSASLRPICLQMSLSIQKSTLCTVLSIIKSHAATCGLFHRELYYIEAIYHAADLKSHVSESHAPDQSQHCIKFSKLNLLKTRPSLDGLAPHFFGEDLSFF